MSDNTNQGLCPTCMNSIRCDTWSEWKCIIHEKRIYGYRTMTECKFYGKRPAKFKTSRCQCEDCLKNPELTVDEEE